MAKIKFRRDTAANWTQANPILAPGEPGFELDTGKLKLGNGTAAWAALAYAGSGAGQSDRLVNGNKSVALGSGGNVDIAGHLTIANEGTYLSSVGKNVTIGNAIFNTKLFVDYNEVGITSTLDVENMPNETATATVKVGGAVATLLSTDDDAGDPVTQYRGQLDVSYTGITLTLANPTTVTNWVFDDNNLKLPAGGDIVDSTGASVLGGSASTGNITFTGDNIGSSNNIVSIAASNYAELNTGDSYIWTEAANASIQVGGAGWVFSDPSIDGSSSNLIEAPNGVYTRSGDSVICDPNMDTVIYASTYATQHTLKLLLCIEGVEDGQTIEDTQSCEMVVARSARNNSVAGSVYGLVYTSAGPLATLSARWNATLSRVEITCRPTSTTNSVSVHSSVTELSTTV